MSGRAETAPDERVAGALAAARAALERRARAIDDLNVFPVADGDTGTNLLATVRAVERAARGRAGGPRADACDAVARAALTAAQGNSGMILSQLVRGAAEALAAPGTVDGPRVAAALRGASKAADRAVRRPVEGTMLTVARRMAEAAEAGAGGGAATVAVLDAAVEAGRRAVSETTGQLEALRRAGVVDAGGLGILVLLEGLTAALAGRACPAGPEGPDPPPPPPEHAPSRYRYCTAFLVEEPGDLAALEAALVPLGDSLLVIGDAGRAKVHLHTDVPERAMERAGAHGAVGAPMLQDMRRQEAERAARLSAGRPRPSARCGALCVAQGEGLARLLRSLGAEVVEVRAGGPLPGARDLAGALAGLGTPEAVLVPGHPALRAAAEEAAALFGAAAVVPALSAPAALAALVAHDPQRGAADDAAGMAASCAGLRVGAVEDGPGGRVVLDGEPLGTAGGLREGLALLLDRAGEAALVTLLIGADAGVAPPEAEAWARGRLPGAEVEAHLGGQAAPALLVGVE